jgi:hypothetical protein
MLRRPCCFSGAGYAGGPVGFPIASERGGMERRVAHLPVKSARPAIVCARSAVDRGHAGAFRRSIAASCRCRAALFSTQALMCQRASRGRSYCLRAGPRHRPGARPCESRACGRRTADAGDLGNSDLGPGITKPHLRLRFPGPLRLRTPPEAPLAEQGRPRVWTYFPSVSRNKFSDVARMSETHPGAARSWNLSPGFRCAHPRYWLLAW